MFAQLKKGSPPAGGMEPLPGWFARRKRDLPPSREILDRIPRGSAA